MIIAETSTFIYSHSCAATCEHFEQHWNGNWFPAKAPTASPFYRKGKRCAYVRSIFLLFCRRARLLEVLHKIDIRFRILVLIFSHFWKLLLKALDKHVFFYMILYLQVFLTYTIQLYTYQRVFRDQKLNMKFFLTDGSSPTVPWSLPIPPEAKVWASATSMRSQILAGDVSFHIKHYLLDQFQNWSFQRPLSLVGSFWTPPASLTDLKARIV